MCYIILLSFLLFYPISCQSNCVTDPKSSNCSQFLYPDSMSKMHVTMMCNMMSGMTICSLKEICQNPAQQSDTYCQWFSLWKESCAEMMYHNNSMCSDYLSMCLTNGSSVLECNTPILDLPDGSLFSQNITKMCTEMPGMTACNCDKCVPLVQYSDICKEMGDTDYNDCSFWNNMCQKIPQWPLCMNVPGEYDVPMRMYFHFSFEDYILFKNWVPSNGLTYTISLIAVFFIALLHEGFKVLKVNMEIRWKMNAKYEPSGSSSVNSKGVLTLVYSPFDWRRDSLRALYRAIDVALHFFVMLIAMTFNGGLFIAVVLGYGVGHLLFATLSRPQIIGDGGLFEEECH